MPMQSHANCVLNMYATHTVEIMYKVIGESARLICLLRIVLISEITCTSKLAYISEQSSRTRPCLTLIGADWFNYLEIAISK